MSLSWNGSGMTLENEKSRDTNMLVQRPAAFSVVHARGYILTSFLSTMDMVNGGPMTIDNGQEKRHKRVVSDAGSATVCVSTFKSQGM